jgi:hypothetical protein
VERSGTEIEAKSLTRSFYGGSRPNNAADLFYLNQWFWYFHCASNFIERFVENCKKLFVYII